MLIRSCGGHVTGAPLGTNRVSSGFFLTAPDRADPVFYPIPSLLSDPLYLERRIGQKGRNIAQKSGFEGKNPPCTGTQSTASVENRIKFQRNCRMRNFRVQSIRSTTHSISSVQRAKSVFYGYTGCHSFRKLRET